VSVRLKLALTIFATGLLTALLVIATVLYAFERFERETTYQRGSAFLARVVAQYDNIVDLRERFPSDFEAWMANLMLFEPHSELYLLDPQGRVLASTAKVALAPEFRVAMGPVMQSAGPHRSPYVMGDDPAHMDADAVIAAEPLRRAVIRNTEPVAGYLYLVCHPGGAAASRWAAARSSFGLPALALIAAIVALASALAAWVTAVVTRPLARLTSAVAGATRQGLERGAEAAPLPAGGGDEFGQLSHMFQHMLATLRTQWAALRRLDHFRREAVSNLSHDLRSPLTASVACLETLDARLADAPAMAEPASAAAQRVEERRLIEVALRNTRNAARLVQSLGDLAVLDEPEYKLQPVAVDAGELLDDIALRFAERACAKQVKLTATHCAAAPAWLDIELFERALANLIENALKCSRPGDAIDLCAVRLGSALQVTVVDSGPGIAAADRAQLFERFYQSRHGAAPAAGAGGKGLGLAIVKRIAELHGGTVALRSKLGQGTAITLTFPPRPASLLGNP
jgi:signal transduction histidine kinase